MNRAISPQNPLAQLRARTGDALAELEELIELQRHDPAAHGAMRAVRLTRHTLESFWIPAIDYDLEANLSPEVAQYDEV